MTANPLREALEPFLRVAKAMDFYTEESMPDMTFPRRDCESRYPDEPRCVTLTTQDFARLAALASEPVAGTALPFNILLTEDDGTGDPIYPGQTGAEAVYVAPTPVGREEIAEIIGEVFRREGATYSGLRKATDAILALGATVPPQVLGATSSPPLVAASHNSGERDPSVMPGYGGGETNRLREILGAFYKTVDVMKSARNSRDKTMNIWADDMKAVEDVMLFLEGLRDATPPALGAADRAAAMTADAVWEALKTQCATTPDKSQVKNLVSDRKENVVAAIRSLAPANTGETGNG